MWGYPGGVGVRWLAQEFAQQGGELGRRTVWGGTVVFASTIVQRLTGLVLLALLARLLCPEDYGLFGMVLALTSLLTVFSDLGLGWAIVQRQDLTPQQVSNVFWVNLALGLLLGLLTIAAGPALAGFYGQERLIGLTLLCGASFPLAALGMQHAALLQRQMAFGAIAAAEIIGLVAGGLCGIALACKGFGVYALVGQQLVQTAVTAAANWFGCPWRPGWPRRSAGLGGAARFGGFLTLYNIVNYFARNLDRILLGRLWGPAALGLYTRAYALMLYPIGLVSLPATRVMIPALATLQHDLARLRQAYLRSLQLIAFASFPLMAFLIVAAREVVALVYGSQWLPAAPLFQILCLAGLGQAVYNATGQVFIATGRTDRLFRAGLALALLLAVAFVLGVLYGPQGVAAAYAAAFTIALVPFLLYAYRTIGLPLRLVLTGISPSLLCAVSLIPVGLLLRRLLTPAYPPWLTLAGLSLVLAAQYLLLSWRFNRPLLKDLARRFPPLALAIGGRLAWWRPAP